MSFHHQIFLYGLTVFLLCPEKNSFYQISKMPAMKPILCVDEICDHTYFQDDKHDSHPEIVVTTTLPDWSMVMTCDVHQANHYNIYLCIC